MWSRSPPRQAPTFPREQGAATHAAAGHIYVMAAARQRGSRLGREPFMKASDIRVLPALASSKVTPVHPRQTPTKTPQADTAVQPFLGQSKRQTGKGMQ